MNKIFFVALLLSASYAASAQAENLTRIARITVDSTQIENYCQLLKDQMNAAIKSERGVISYSVYQDKSTPSKITIIEVYADNAAYLSHRETVHFKKYKEATTNMVKSLELTEVSPYFSVQKANN